MHGIRQCFEMSGYFASSKFRFTDISQNFPNFREVNAVNPPALASYDASASVELNYH